MTLYFLQCNKALTLTRPALIGVRLHTCSRGHMWKGTAYMEVSYLPDAGSGLACLPMANYVMQVRFAKSSPHFILAGPVRILYTDQSAGPVWSINYT